MRPDRRSQGLSCPSCDQPFSMSRAVGTTRTVCTNCQNPLAVSSGLRRRRHVTVSPNGDSGTENHGGLGQVRVSRGHLIAAGGRRMAIYVDGDRAGSVKELETVGFSVTPGSHEIRAGLDWCRSRPIRVVVPIGAHVDLTLGFTGGPLLYLLLSLVMPRRALELRPEEPVAVF